MIKVINCNKKNYLNNLTKFLDLRRSGKKIENKTIEWIPRQYNFPNVVRFVLLLSNIELK